MTQEEISRKLHITRQAYANYENGLREPDFSTLVKLANLFQVTTDTLLESYFVFHTRS